MTMSELKISVGRGVVNPDNVLQGQCPARTMQKMHMRGLQLLVAFIRVFGRAGFQQLVQWTGFHGLHNVPLGQCQSSIFLWAAGGAGAAAAAAAAVTHTKSCLDNVPQI